MKAIFAHLLKKNPLILKNNKNCLIFLLFDSRFDDGLWEKKETKWISILLLLQ